MTDIHDIKPLEKIGINLDVYVYLVMSAIVLAVLVAALVYLNRRKKKPPVFLDFISPEDAAMKVLANLSGLMNSNGKQFYYKISVVLREYVQKKFNVDATQMTTEELLPRIEALKLDSDLVQGIREFVHSSDPIKFAGQPPDIKNMKRHFEFVKDFVKKTSLPLRDNTEHSMVESRTVEKDVDERVSDATPIT